MEESRKIHTAIDINRSSGSTAPVFDIKRFAINDGPGIRITIFLKGCPLQCAWCHNPEGISMDAEKIYSEGKCIGCGICIENCPEDACELTPEGIITDRDKCVVCGTCAENCPALATEISGEARTVEDIMKEIEKEVVFFQQSGGGVTFSGGEPLLYPDFLIEILDECGNRGIHRTVDTSGLVKTDTLLEVARRTDLFLYDLKLMDTDRHKNWTRVGNTQILKNLRILSESGASINVRIPLVKGVNDDNENIKESASFISSLAGDKKQVNILPYHNIAEAKYRKLGKSFNENGLKEPNADDLQRVKSLFESEGLKVIIGG